MKSPELMKILEDHMLWLRTGGKEGTQLDLSGAFLRSVDFRSADLRDANLRSVDLAGADLTGARMPVGRIKFIGEFDSN
jgi:hypothetical protein